MLALNLANCAPPVPVSDNARHGRYVQSHCTIRLAQADAWRRRRAGPGSCSGWHPCPNVVRRARPPAAASGERPAGVGVSQNFANGCAAVSPASTPSPAAAPTAPALPQRLLGVDYGTATTGLAVGRNGFCNALKALPTPRTAKLSDIAKQVLEVAAGQGCDAVVVGIPVQPGGNIVKPHTDSPVGRRCRSLAHTLALLGKEAGVSVYLYNEKSTTRAVVKGMGRNWQDRLTNAEKQARGVDAEAAAMLLRLYFGNPRLAVRINPRPNVVVVDRGEEDEVVQQQRGQEGKTEGWKLEEGMVEGGQGKGGQGQGQSAGQVGGEGKAAVKGEGEGQAGQA
ncbi:hypothetical protein CHLRE_09g409951v5 [Chlamydomonas reinhardtii]|uniref:YqgF/RNase H-like domain-containing protein n=1 Tax=Chlamydomonas reinhardtii TaxID=3055 RepID=A0A2K3DFI9_CHLRE|nr:uncharacterized protein CHLRE_09g409951v5 [Chlamydomonas reinhardtii]PNW79300.1 hypothetical protein CHLRE_09g409951v5 [Chlamydomonas reinhardtii]